MANDVAVPKRWVWWWMVVAAALIVGSLLLLVIAGLVHADPAWMLRLAIVHGASWLVLAAAGIVNLALGGHRVR